jgi:hypothetical protein
MTNLTIDQTELLRAAAGAEHAKIARALSKRGLQPTMTKITEAQAELLNRAVAAPEGAIDAGAQSKLAKALIKNGLAISLPVEGGASRLIITEAGRAAIAPQAGADERASSASDQADRAGDFAEGDAAGAEPPRADAAPPGGEAADRLPKGKLGVLIGLLKRPEGAAVEEMMAATGWQAHSVRGAMSGALKKKLGMAIESEKAAAGRIYRIPTTKSASD